MAPRPIDRRRWLRAAAGGAAAVVAGLMNCPIAGRAAWCASELEPGVGPADIVAGRPCDGGPCDRESCEGVAAENSSDPADAVDRWSRPFDELLDRFLKETGAPGAALAVARGERLVYVGSRGVADLRSGTPLAPTAAAFDALSAALPVSKPKPKRKG